MGLIAQVARNLTSRPSVPASSGGMWQGGLGGGPQTYEQFARRGYMGNEIVFSAIELLATSAAEPHIIGRRWRRESPRFAGMRDKEIKDDLRRQVARLVNCGRTIWEANEYLIKNGFIIQIPNHPLVRLLNAPNPFMSRGQFWSTGFMDMSLAGNFYVLKARYQDGPLAGAVGELWRLRPDRVRIIPDKDTFCKYEYRVSSQSPVTYEYKDVFHWKARHPLNDYYGMPPLMAFSARMDIDSYMEGFLKTFFEGGGTGPGGIITSKEKLSEENKAALRDQKRKLFGGPSGWHEWMVLDNTETTFQQTSLNRGIRDALPKEIDAQTEARLSMGFGIPGSILGTLIGYESSSYANKRMDRETFWKVTMAPKLSDLDDVMNLSLTPEFSGIDEVMFDLSDIEALQEEVDKKVTRWLKMLAGMGCSLQEFRDATGLDPENLDGTFLLPATIIPTRGDSLEEQRPVVTEMLRSALAPRQIEEPKIVAEPRCPKCGRRVGKDVNVGASLDCPRCGEYFVVEA